MLSRRSLYTVIHFPRLASNSVKGFTKKQNIFHKMRTPNCIIIVVHCTIEAHIGPFEYLDIIKTETVIQIVDVAL